MSGSDLERLRIRAETPRGLLTGSVILIALGAASAGASGHWLWSHLTAAPPIPVRTAVVRPPGAVSGASLVAGGWIEAARPGQPVAVAAQIAERIIDLPIAEGDAVQPGGDVAQLYGEDLAQQAAEAAAATAQAKAALRYAEANAARVRSLAALATPDQQERSAAEVDMARAALTRSEAQLSQARLHVEQTTVRAPDGPRPWKVLKIHHRLGDRLPTDGDRLICELYDPTLLQARVDVPQRAIRSVRVGGAVELRTDTCPDKAYAATVLRIEPLADIAKNTITVRVAITDADALLYPEMTCTVSFLPDPAAGGEQALVPQSAVRHDDAGAFALVAEQGRVRVARLEAGDAVGPWLTVRSGLSSGTRVILGEDPRLGEGSRVTEAE